MARQRLRLVQVHKPGSFDDQKTPTEILNDSESPLVLDEQGFMEHLLSQVRQILGTPDWKDPVPAALAQLVGARSMLANCLASDTEGHCVYATGPQIGERYQVTRVDRGNAATLPAVGMIVSKESATECHVQGSGEVAGVFSGLIPGRQYFVGSDGKPSLDVASASGTFVHRVGMAISHDVLYLHIDPFLTRRA